MSGWAWAAFGLFCVYVVLGVAWIIAEIYRAGL